MTPREVVHYGALYFGVRLEDILQDRRRAHIGRARFAIYAGLWLRAELEGRAPSVTAIGRTMQRDHTTIMYGVPQAWERAESDALMLEGICAIATATEEAYLEACKAPLHVPEEPSQQLEKSNMEEPEYTEARINQALAAAGHRDITVYWDGNIVGRDDPAVFTVFDGEDETPYWVVDCGPYFALKSERAPRHYTTHAEERTYPGIAEEIAAIVRETEETGA